MSISVRPVHIEWFRFNFVFSRVSLATTNAVTELQYNEKSIHYVCNGILPQIDDAHCTLYVCDRFFG